MENYAAYTVYTFRTELPHHVGSGAEGATIDEEPDDSKPESHVTAKRDRMAVGSTTSPWKPPHQARKSQEHQQDCDDVVIRVLSTAYYEEMENFHSSSEAERLATICDEATVHNTFEVSY